MGLRTIIRMGHPNLRRVAQPVELDDIGSDKMNTLLRDMEDTLHDSGGIGLAAPQIDVDLRLAIIEIPGGPTRYGDIEAMPLTVFFNPVIEALTTDREGYWEGCLSVPGLRGFVERPQHIRVSYIDANKEPAEIELQGFLATVMQHEFDHLDGRLYIDHITDTRKLMFEEEWLRHHAES
ncbi:MAG: peptide deformylase [Pseudomonadota bacterium]|nr:peptide deformylase [Pseudomonadota bacterium]